jgi:hypothetical protein
VDNAAEPGVLHGVSLGWKGAVSQSGEVLVLRFREKAASGEIEFTRLLVNDRKVPEAPVLTLAPQRLPQQFELSVVPNPFNPMTRIQYAIPAGSSAKSVELRIFDGNGRLVYEAREAAQEPGYHGHLWNGTDRDGRALASGIYFVHVNAGPWSQTQKVSLLK